MANHFCSKTYGLIIGLSAVFRQPHADSHCRFLHGYSLSFKFMFGCHHLDEKNWVVDFGGLKPLKKWLEDHFDHKMILDKNDPHLEDFRKLEEKGLAEIVVFDGVGVEREALEVLDKVLGEDFVEVEDVDCDVHDRADEDQAGK